jgi:hypothetical protein
MNITSRPFDPAKSPSDTVFPSTFGSENAGAFVPSGNIVEAVFTIAASLFRASQAEHEHTRIA